MRRRRLLALAGTGAGPLLAGCPGGNGTDGSDSDAGDDGEADGSDAGSSDEGSDGGAGDGGSTPGTDPSPTGADTPTASISISAPEFDDGEPIPEHYTCAGPGSSPPLEVEAIGGAAATVALIVDDPDAPRAEPFVHWLAWDVPTTLETWPTDIGTGGRPSELQGGAQGTNSTGDLGYLGPCPPEGDGPHRYRFTVFAVDTTLGLDAGAERAALESALEGHVLARDRLVGTFGRE
jgi:Raf kinase inhibitor-like YbhB/YbcL family protein